MCLNPIKIIKEGNYKEDNYRGNKGEPYTIVAFSKCGRCQECMNEKANNWVIRNYYEQKAHEKTCFITLTYKENTYFLVRKDLQDFMKRLRKKLHKMYKIKVRLYYSGEYGTISKRPHFHIILYGWTDENKEFIGFNKKKNPIYKSKIIEECWGLGRTTIQDFHQNEIAYIALYQTERETEKREYVLSREKIKEFENFLKSKYQDIFRRRQVINAFFKELKSQDEKFSKYIKIREFNGWSKGIGFKQFFKENEEKIKNNEYIWKEYIQEKEFVTPSSWVKKLANKKYNSAIAEMLLRSQELASKSEEKEKADNISKHLYEKTQDILKRDEQLTRALDL